MARNYANIVTAIWRDPEFRALNAAAQRTYLMLVTQPDISAVGLLDLTVKRWASLAVDTSPESIRADLTELHRARFVVIDGDTEELLVRSFTKWDRGYGNPKRRPIIIRSAAEIQSPKLRVALMVEFAKLRLPTDFAPDRAADSLSGPVVDPADETRAPAMPKPAKAQENRLSGSHANGHRGALPASDGVVVTQAELLPTPTLNPHPASQLQSSGHLAVGAVAVLETPTETENQRAGRLAHTYTDIVTTVKYMGVFTVVKKAIRDGYTDEQILAALADFAENRDKVITATTFRLALEGMPIADIGKRVEPSNRLRGQDTRADSAKYDDPEMMRFK